jgi:hypothetical protein
VKGALRAAGPIPILVALSLAFGQQGQQAADFDWQAVDEAFGLAGEMLERDVHRYSLPRSDLRVKSAGIEIQPGFALGSWVAFRPMGEGAEVMAMGDLVLTEDEYNSVITVLQENGISQTAIHKHLPDESPAIWWVHIDAEGDGVEIAQSIRVALEETGTPFEAPSGAGEQEIGLDTARLDKIIGRQGEASGGIYKFNIPHAGTVTVHGTEVPPSMGTAIALNFQPTGEGRAAINGDFVMTADEIEPVIRALREHDIQVVSLHNHMTAEEPRLFFAHFWAVGNASELADGLRAALDQVDTAQPE